MSGFAYESGGEYAVADALRGVAPNLQFVRNSLQLL
jgi:hypothetical protein